MLFDEFVKVSSSYWRQYLKAAFNLLSEQREREPHNTFLFPTMLLCVKTDKHYIAQLLGSSSVYSELIVKKHLESSLNRYFNQFDFDEKKVALFDLSDKEGVTIQNLILSNSDDSATVEKRFPFVTFEGSTNIQKIDLSGPVLRFNGGHRSSIFCRCTLVNGCLGALRVRGILYLTVINKGFTKQKYLAMLPQSINNGEEIRGVTTCKTREAHRRLLASEFTSLFLTNKLRETTIGTFLKAHPEILEEGLGSGRSITEPYLKWIDRSPENTDDAINPDLMVEREDGYYDIYDLKTAALERQSLTKGKRSRRRFIDNVNEGIAQLVNYENYFNFPRNKKYALEKYGVKVRKPNLVLVVGNFENAKKDEIEEACRAFRKITIVDYESLMHLFINARSSDGS